MLSRNWTRSNFGIVTSRALLEREVQEHRHSVDVEERQDGEHAVGVLQVDVDAALCHIRHEIAVAQHDALGDAGGPRRVRQDGDVRRRIERDLRRRAPLGEQCAQVRMGGVVSAVPSRTMRCSAGMPTASAAARAWGRAGSR
jgi:hypothetical protein